MTVTPRQLNRATLARQLLLQREPLGVRDGVRRVVALQAQQPASPYLAMWNRLAGFEPGELDEAFADRSVVKATLVRVTLHTVHAEDHSAVHAAMQPTLRAARLHDRRFTSTGLSAADADALVPELLKLTGEPRTGAEIEAWLEERLDGAGTDDAAKWAWWALRHYAPLHHASTGGPWSFGAKPSFVAGASGYAYEGQAADEQLQHLVLRYLEGFGPASVADIAQFALVPRARARDAVKSLSDRIVQVDLEGGGTLVDVPGGVIPDEDVPAPPRLLPMWDSVLLAYADRSRVIPPDYRTTVARSNGDVLPTVLVDGYVAGVWRPVDDGVEVTAFHPLPDATWEELDAEARGLVQFLADRDPAVYSRYGHWWGKLSGAEVRVLAH